MDETTWHSFCILPFSFTKQPMEKKISSVLYPYLFIAFGPLWFLVHVMTSHVCGNTLAVCFMFVQYSDKKILNGVH
jgi:hypothetical protein